MRVEVDADREQFGAERAVRCSIGHESCLLRAKASSSGKMLGRRCATGGYSDV
jgi:hypothetical protein